MRSQTPKDFVFISHLQADRESVKRVESFLESSNIAYQSSPTGDTSRPTKADMSEAIKNCMFFIACFSINSSLNESASMHQELLQAVEEWRKRRLDSGWLIPIRFSDHQLPRLSLGAGTDLSDLQAIDLFLEFNEGLRRLRKTILEKIGCSHDWQVVSRKSGESRKVDEDMLGSYGRIWETWMFECVVTSKCRFCDETKTHSEYEKSSFQG
ncbi:MAG: toll/interleukin-1 receptor domain-containing protein [Proteobacteria bacterium]|nr:toll/interleukin-1 receptor domain-containing protein [Pseudomonadota bacterium]